MSLPEFRSAILRDPAAPSAYDLDAPGAFVHLTPEGFARMVRWAAVVGASENKVALAQNKVGRLSAGRAARRAAMTAPNQGLTVEIGGKRISFGIDVRVSNHFFSRVLKRDASGKYLEHEPAVVRALRSSLEPGDLLVDIGAHVGYFSCYAAALGATVLAVEMQSTLCDAIRVNAALNDLWRVHTICAALGRDPSMAQLVRLNPAPGMQVQSEKARAGWVPLGSQNHDVVPILTVDQLLAMPAETDIRRTVVKIDVEGAEAMVLSGARRTIAAGAATFIVEIHPHVMPTFSAQPIDVLAEFVEDKWRYILMEETSDREISRNDLLMEIDALVASRNEENITVRFEPRPFD